MDYSYKHYSTKKVYIIILCKLNVFNNIKGKYKILYERKEVA